MSYFHNDCAAISESALSSPDGFARVATFVLLTIQQQLSVVPKAMADVDSKGKASKFLFGSKRAGYAYVQEHKTHLHAQCVRLVKGEIDLNRLLIELIAIPGLGVTKASFVAQCATMQGACLDTHNLKRLGLSDQVMKLSKSLKPASVLRKIESYNAVWQAQGNSAYWWDSWCDHLAARNAYASRGLNGAHVSALHRVAILPSQAKQGIAA